ncbi:MAG: DUF927 domain-containing protein [Rubrivivax sp.]|nr:DUF927 domain-containing protein [Rubrivivax sp.]
MLEPVDQFRAALARRGIVPKGEEIVADGRLHRCDAEGRGGRGDAAYVLHLGKVPAGGFQNWRDGGGWETWRADIGRTLTTDEESAHRLRWEMLRRERELEEAKRKTTARKRALSVFEEAALCDSHPYTVRKGIQTHGARLQGDRLVLPLRDADGTIHSLQFIGADGEKRYLTGGRKAGCYFDIGQPDGVLCVAEGFATGASLHEATGYAVAVAFDAGNLAAVTKALHKKHPDLRVIVCADDDYLTAGNPGISKATEAALCIGALLAVPDFGVDRPERATDFNDLHQFAGLDAVRRCIEAARKPGDPNDDPPQADESDESTGAVPSPGDTATAAPASDTGPECKFGGGRFRLTQRGVFYIAKDGTTGLEKMPQWICGGLAVVAATRDAKSTAWGRLLEWRDADGVRHQWAMPLELLQGDGVDVRRELAQAGLAIAPGRAARELLASYVQVWPVKDRARCVERLGWQGAVYVTPAESIGERDERVVFQNAHAIEPAYSVAGTADDWRESVARLAQGNSRMVFALSVAFAGPLADVAGEDSGGFHMRGKSSSGKSTASKAAASVWGHPNTYMRGWRATANGLEGMGALHNDGCLILDELSACEPKEAGEAIYMLANGQGKARASRSGSARASARWRLLFLSNGEVSLAALMAQAGRKPNAGQEVRLADFDADAGKGLGAFEELHDQPTPAALSLALKDAATRHHGAAGVAWLRAIVADRDKLADFIADGVRQFVAENAPADAAGQVQRVAQRFGLVAVAGELATYYGVTGWPEGEATQAASRCFAAWLDSFGGTGNREDRTLLAQVRGFFETHGASRFEDVAATFDQRIVNRAGFYRAGADGAREFLVLPEAFKRDVCAGFDLKAATRCLLAQGWIVPGGDGRPTQKPRLPGIGTARVYVFTNKWADAE